MCWQGTARAHVLDAEHQVHGCAHEGGTGEAVESSVWVQHACSAIFIKQDTTTAVHACCAASTP